MLVCLRLGSRAAGGGLAEDSGEGIVFSEAGDQKPSRATGVEILERRRGGGRGRLNLTVRNLSESDRKQKLLLEKRGMTTGTRFVLCASLGEGWRGESRTAVRKPVSRDV